MTIFFNIPVQFSTETGGLTRNDGDYSAERLREDFLLPLVQRKKDNEQIVVYLGDDPDKDGFYAANFLEKGIVGLISYGYISKKDFLSTFKFTHSKNKCNKINEDNEHCYNLFKRAIYRYVNKLG